MTREEWLHVKSIAAEAWARPAGERAAFTAVACAGNDELGREVVSLLESMAEANDRFESSALATPDARSAVIAAIGEVERPPGASGRVGPWRLIRELGHGGMGTVYLAERGDAGFTQRAALKLVRGGYVDELLRQRFSDERRILASLEHPHIARFIDGGATDAGLPYVVIEYVEGVPIDAFCATRRLGVRERVLLFRGVCAAVQYAHERLIVHRDLKASNILVTAGGTPKLLDFGIAKLLDPSLALESTRTRFRMVTPASASPEQLRGEPVTTASDVYSLGILLYRVLTGQSPYRLATQAETDLIHAVCAQTPEPPSAVVQRAEPRDGSTSSIDRDLDRIVLKALRKEPARRYATAGQLSDDLQRYLDGLPVEAAPDTLGYRVRTFVRRNRQMLAAGAASGLAVALVGIVAVSLRPPSGWSRWLKPPAAVAPPRTAPSQSVKSSEPVNLTRHIAADDNPKWSPDGSRIMFSTNRDGVDRLYVMNADGTSPTRLNDHPSGEWKGSWSPDGRTVVFTSSREGGGMFAMSVFGSAFTKISSLTATTCALSPDGRHVAFTTVLPFRLYVMDVNGAGLKRIADDAADPDWSPDGSRLVFGGVTTRSIYVMNADGSHRERLTRDSVDGTPVWSPNGTSIAFTSDRGDHNDDIYVMSSDGSGVVRITSGPAADTHPAWSPDGKRLAFTSNRDGNNEIYVMTVPLLNPRRLTDNVVEDMVPAWSPDGRDIAFSSNRDGKLEIYIMDAGGGSVRRLTSNTSDDQWPSFSPDGRKIAFASERDGQWGIYAMNRDGNEEVRLMAPAVSGRPSWSPDGTRISATSARGIFVMNADGTNVVTLTKPGDDEPAWSPDGASILFRRSHGEGQAELYLMSPDGSHSHRLTRINGVKGSAAWSPDGARLAFMSEHDGPASPASQEIYVMNADGTGLRRLTHNRSMDNWPAWSPDGTKVAFHSMRDGNREIYVLTLEQGR